jgi:hypothetical protein
MRSLTLEALNIAGLVGKNTHGEVEAGEYGSLCSYFVSEILEEQSQGASMGQPRCSTCTTQRWSTFAKTSLHERR